MTTVGAALLSLHNEKWKLNLYLEGSLEVFLEGKRDNICTVHVMINAKMSVELQI